MTAEILEGVALSVKTLELVVLGHLLPTDNRPLVLLFEIQDAQHLDNLTKYLQLKALRQTLLWPHFPRSVFIRTG